MRNYLKLKCTICARSKDTKVDTTSAMFPKCTITLGCAGILKPYQYTDNPDTITDAAPIGSQNWYSRFKTVTGFADVLDPEIPISYGDNSEVFIAVPIQSNEYIDDSYKLAVSITSPTLENRQFREYVFNTTSHVDRLLGVESGVGKKVLRFSATQDEIKVLKNGALMIEGSESDQYQVARSSNTVPQNTIVFNSAIRGTNQFKVIVSKPVLGRTQVVEFGKLTITDQVDSCWRNVNSVNFRGVTYHIFHKNFSGVSLSSGQLFSISGIDLMKDGMASIPLTDCLILLSGGPTQIDRVLTTVVKLGTLDAVRYPFSVVKIDTSMVVKMREALVSEVFPPLSPNTFSNEPLLSSSVKNDITDSLSHNVIISPLQ